MRAKCASFEAKPEIRVSNEADEKKKNKGFCEREMERE